MFWTGFFTGFAACLAIGLAAHFVQDRRQRAAFIASLSPSQRERLRGFESVGGDWHEFRDLLLTSVGRYTCCFIWWNNSFTSLIRSLDPRGIRSELGAALQIPHENANDETVYAWPFIIQAGSDALDSVSQRQELRLPRRAFRALHAGELIQGGIADLAGNDFAVV
jgi:hypothetical protein